MSTLAQLVTRLTIPEEFAQRKGTKICASFSDLLAQSEIQMALDMLDEHPWMVLRQAPPSKQLPLPFQNRPYLHIAVMMGSMPLIDRMLDKGAPLEELDTQKRSAIFYAVQDAVGEDPRSERIANALIQRGVRCDGLTKEGVSLVSEARTNIRRSLSCFGGERIPTVSSQGRHQLAHADAAKCVRPQRKRSRPAKRSRDQRHDPGCDR